VSLQATHSRTRPGKPHHLSSPLMIDVDSLTVCSLSVPEVANRLTFNEIKTANEPFAAFTFYYRSTGESFPLILEVPRADGTPLAALKSLGIINRTPSPSPEPEPGPKCLDQMSTEELRAEVARVRVRSLDVLCGTLTDQFIERGARTAGATVACQARAGGQCGDCCGRRWR
jgi:hypothetical protein